MFARGVTCTYLNCDRDSELDHQMTLQSQLLQGFSKQGQVSDSEKDKAEIAQWTEKAAQPNFAEPDALLVRPVWARSHLVLLAAPSH
jgi:hypothetical protein